METIKVMGTGGGLFVMDLTPEVEEKIEKGILTVIEDEAGEKPLEAMKLAELKDVCRAEGIDPGGASTEAEFIEAIEEARTAPDDPDPDPGDDE